MSDEELIAAVAAGDHLALRELFERHAGWVAARLRRRMPVDAVEDVVQETFIGVWRGASTFRGGGEVGAWIWGIARRQAATWARKHNRPPSLLDPQSGADPADVATRRIDLQEAFERLGPEGAEQRETARMVLVEGRRMADVAAHFRISEGTVKSRVHRIRRKLREALKGEDT